MHEGILFTQDEDLDRLLLGAGKRCYIKFLLEHLEKELDSILSWRGIYEKLKRASSIGNQECVKAILNRFEDIESRDPAIKLLHYAVEKGDYDLVNSLIKNDANVNIQDRNNKTALHYAVSSYGDIQNVNKMVMLLVESGAKIDTQDSDGKTALHYAAASNKDEIVRLLLKEGANEEIKDKSGKTFLDMVASGTKSFLLNVLHPGGLLHHAAKEGNIDRAKRLLAKGKDVNAKNSHRESPLSVAIKAGNLEVIELLVNNDAVITEKAIQYARGVYEKCEEDKKQAHLSVLTFPVNIHNEQLFKKAIEQGDLKKIKSYVDKGTVISGEIIQCARDACKICKEDKKQAHLSVLTFLMKTSKDQFKEAIESSNLERVKLFVGKGAVITKEIIQRVELFYNTRKKERVYIANYPGGMKAEKQNRTGILNFLKDNVRSNSNLVNETATSSQVVNEEDNNQSENPGLESAGSKQLQENVMSNGKASIEEAIGNNYRRGKMSKNKKSIKQGLFIDVIYDVKRMKNFLESNDDKLVLKKALNQVNTELTKKENTRGLDLAKKNIRINQKKRLTEAKELLTEKISNIEMNAKTAASSVNDVSATTSSQAAPVSEDVSQDIRSEILVPSSSVSPDVGNVSTAENINDNMVASENSGQVNDVQSGDEQPDSPPLSPQSSASGDVEDTEASANAAVTIPKKVDSLVSDKDVTDGSDNEFVKVSPPPEDNTHSPQPIRVQGSSGYTPLKVVHARDIIVKTRNTQNLQVATSGVQQAALSGKTLSKLFRNNTNEFTIGRTIREYLNTGRSEIQLLTSDGYITLDLNTIDKAGSEGLRNIVKVLTDSYKNGALNDRTRNAIETHEEDPYSVPEAPAPTPDPILTPTPVPTPNPILTSIPDQVPTPLVANENSGQVDDTQTTTKQLGKPISPSVPPTMHVSQNNINVQPSNSTSTVTATRSSTPTTQVVPKNVPAASVPPVTSKSSGQADNVQINSKQSTNPSNIANASSDVNSKPITKEPVATESNQQNSLPPLSSFDLSSPQRFVDDKVSSITGVLRSEVSIEDNTSSLDITDDEYSEDSSVVSEDSLLEDVTDEKEPLLDKTNKGDSTLKSSNSPQSTKSSKLSVIAASALAIAGIISGVAVAVYLEMLAVGIAVGACCLVAAVIIYCCNRPSSSFKGSNVELIADEELAAQQTVN